MDMSGVSGTDLAKFNSGLPIIFRLDSIHRELHNAKYYRDHKLYYAALQAFFAEVIRVMKKNKTVGDEIEQHRRYYSQVKEAYFKIESLKRNKESVPAYLYDIFFDWELEMTILEQKYNMGMPKREEGGL